MTTAWRPFRPLRTGLVSLALLAALAAPGRAGEQRLSSTANALFGAVSRATSDRRPEVIGGYTRGCIRGAVELPADGPGWQVMRPSRNRAWGHPDLVDFVERLAAAAKRDGLPGLLVGDMAQPRGGPMRFGHASHQIGLDVDIWLQPMPERRLSEDERDALKAISVVKEKGVEIDPTRFGRQFAALIHRAALFPEVERVFVHPGIKKALCATAGEDRAWLAKVRPWYGHDDHMHVRLQCPAGQPQCREQDDPPDGDGCGAELKSWLRKAVYRPPVLTRPARPLPLAALPRECREVLRAD